LVQLWWHLAECTDSIHDVFNSNRSISWFIPEQLSGRVQGRIESQADEVHGLVGQCDKHTYQRGCTSEHPVRGELHPLTGKHEMTGSSVTNSDRSESEVMERTRHRVASEGPPTAEMGRERARPFVAATAVIAIAVIGVVVALGSGSNDETRSSIGAGATTTVASDPSVTSLPASTTTLIGGLDRLSSVSRITFDGVGPVTFGMTRAAAAQASRSTIVDLQNAGCYDAFQPEADSGISLGDVTFADLGEDSIAVIGVKTPKISTAEGIHIGSTNLELSKAYPKAVFGDAGAGYGQYTMTDARGHYFFFSTKDAAISFITVAVSEDAFIRSTRC
jgi:hypothetical protein